MKILVSKLDRKTTTSWYHQDQDLTKKKKKNENLFNARISKKQQLCKASRDLNY